MDEKLFTIRQLSELSGYRESTLIQYMYRHEGIMTPVAEEDGVKLFSGETLNALLEKRQGIRSKGQFKRYANSWINYDESEEGSVNTSSNDISGASLIGRCGCCPHMTVVAGTGKVSYRCRLRKDSNHELRDVETIKNEECYIWSHATEQEWEHVNTIAELRLQESIIDRALDNIDRIKSEMASWETNREDVELLYSIMKGYYSNH